jgi:hypothetical protein
MTKTILFTLLITAAAHSAAAQSVPLATPEPAPAPVAPLPPAPPPPVVTAPLVAEPVVAAPFVAAPVVAAPVLAAPQLAAPEPPPPPDINYDFDFDFSRFADLDVQVDKAMKASQKALEKLPKIMAMQLRPLPSLPPAAPVGQYKFGSDENAYDQARNMIERDQYDRALQVLDRVIDGKGSRVDAAMYWKAYSLSKLARRPEALTVLDNLEKEYPSGQWVRDAKALEVELRQASGQSVDADNNDEEIKLLALRGVSQSDPETALPLLEKVLNGNSSVRVKSQALFVLSQNRAARARTVLANVAKNGSNPELRLSAIRHLGNRNDTESVQALDEIYRSTSDREVKQQILRSFMSSPNGGADRLAQLARTEKDEELQKMAIRYLGSQGRSDNTEALRAIYSGDASVDIKKEVINALASNPRNAATLVGLAKTEKNNELKKVMVQRLSTMRGSPEAQQYMLEILSDGK